MPSSVQLSFTKVVFPPTNASWVHTYTAGSFFAVASFTNGQSDLSNPVMPRGGTGEDLNALGRTIFNQLETEG